jgi:hypothetical protein
MTITANIHITFIRLDYHEAINFNLTTQSEVRLKFYNFECENGSIVTMAGKSIINLVEL